MSNTLEKEASVKNGVGRMIFCIAVIALEVVFIILMMTRLSRHAAWIEVLTRVIGLLLVLYIYNKPGNSSMKPGSKS